MTDYRNGLESVELKVPVEDAVGSSKNEDTQPVMA